MDDLELQVSSQEPSLSSKYLHEGPLILDTLLIKILTHDFMNDLELQVSCQEPSFSSKYLHQRKRGLHTLLIDIDLIFGMHD